MLFLPTFLLATIFCHQGVSGWGNYVPSDCEVGTCQKTLSRIDRNNTSSYCSTLMSSFVCLERILGRCTRIFDGYGKPEVNRMVTFITSELETHCHPHHGNQGPCVTSWVVVILCAIFTSHTLIMLGYSL